MSVHASAVCTRLISAASAPENTLWKPMVLRAVLSKPEVSFACRNPSESEMAGPTAGSSNTETEKSGFCNIERSFSTSFCSCRAPVGQTCIHWPQDIQELFSNPSLPTVPTCIFEPRFMNSRAETN